MSEEAPTLPPRRAALAVLLTLLGAGIGHIYAGRGRRGVVLLVLSYAWVPLMLALAFAEPARWVLFAIVGLFLFTLGVTLYAFVGSALAARRAERPYRRRPYNHARLYVGLAVLNALWLLGGAYVIQAGAFEAFRIPTLSMGPGVRRGDRILVNKRLRPLERGDLIVFRASDPPGSTYFKRVIGLPGETVGFQRGLVTVDGRPLAAKSLGGGIYEEDAGPRHYRIIRGPRGTTGARQRVPDGHVYVLGDHRENSRDSRVFGPIPIAAVRGLAQYVISRDRADVLR